jgi:hypothetical protein
MSPGRWLKVDQTHKAIYIWRDLFGKDDRDGSQDEN